MCPNSLVIDKETKKCGKGTRFVDGTMRGEGRSHQEEAEISCCPGVGTTKADTFTLSHSNMKIEQ